MAFAQRPFDNFEVSRRHRFPTDSKLRTGKRLRFVTVRNVNAFVSKVMVFDKRR